MLSIEREVHLLLESGKIVLARQKELVALLQVIKEDLVVVISVEVAILLSIESSFGILREDERRRGTANSQRTSGGGVQKIQRLLQAGETVP